MIGLLLVLADTLPNRRPTFESSPTPYVVLMLVGMAVGVVGHLVRSKVLVAAGVGAVFLGTFLLPLVLYLSKT